MTPGFMAASIAFPVGILLRLPPNLLMSRSNQRGIDDHEKPAMTGSWARKMAPELHHYPRRQGYLRERQSR
jgi:hypothetical protein